jgi:hypothetical protein
MKKFKLLLLALTCFTFFLKTSGQNQFPDIDPKWDRYYDNNPSGIEDHFSGTDFIKIIDLVNFIPQSSMLKKDVQLLKKLLLMLDAPTLRQMKINGDYYSRTFKHDDYFTLYNLYYTKITKETFDKYCPYLLVLMDLDKVINAH